MLRDREGALAIHERLVWGAGIPIGIAQERGDFAQPRLVLQGRSQAFSGAQMLKELLILAQVYERIPQFHVECDRQLAPLTRPGEPLERGQGLLEARDLLPMRRALDGPLARLLPV